MGYVIRAMYMVLTHGIWVAYLVVPMDKSQWLSTCAEQDDPNKLVNRLSECWVTASARTSQTSWQTYERTDADNFIIHLFFLKWRGTQIIQLREIKLHNLWYIKPIKAWPRGQRNVYSVPRDHVSTACGGFDITNFINWFVLVNSPFS